MELTEGGKGHRIQKRHQRVGDEKEEWLHRGNNGSETAFCEEMEGEGNITTKFREGGSSMKTVILSGKETRAWKKKESLLRGDNGNRCQS